MEERKLPAVRKYKTMCLSQKYKIVTCRLSELNQGHTRYLSYIRENQARCLLNTSEQPTAQTPRLGLIRGQGPVLGTGNAALTCPLIRPPGECVMRSTGLQLYVPLLQFHLPAPYSPTTACYLLRLWLTVLLTSKRSPQSFLPISNLTWPSGNMLQSADPQPWHQVFSLSPTAAITPFPHCSITCALLC